MGGEEERPGTKLAVNRIILTIPSDSFLLLGRCCLYHIVLTLYTGSNKDCPMLPGLVMDVSETYVKVTTECGPR